MKLFNAARSVLKRLLRIIYKLDVTGGRLADSF
jgi:hypothetical protein